MSRIHPTAIVSPQAVLGQDVSIGPFCVIEDDVTIGDGCRLESRVSVCSGTRLGKRNHLHDGAVVGGKPQHARCPEELGQTIVGEGNVIREYVTIHRGLHPGSDTVIGSGNMLMIGVHVAHDCRIGDQCIMANNALLAGHVTVGSKAYLSGAVAVHQFCRIGSYAMVGGQAHITKDVPPYVLLDGQSTLVVGLNSIGLKRNGFREEEIAQLKQAYRVIYRSGLKWADVLAALRLQFSSGPAAAFHAFLSEGKRGFVQERRIPRSATLPLHGSDSLDEGETGIRRVG